MGNAVEMDQAPVPAPVLAYDVFNGDADGLCALHQLRLAQPASGGGGFPVSRPRANGGR